MVVSVIKFGTFELALSRLRTSHNSFFVLFTAEKKADGTGRWCPDCVAAHSVLDPLFKDARPSTEIVMVEVSREEWKVSPGQEHMLRKAPFNVKSIPTLCQCSFTDFGELKILVKLVDSECEQIERVTTLINEAQ